MLNSPELFNRLVEVHNRMISFYLRHISVLHMFEKETLHDRIERIRSILHRMLEKGSERRMRIYFNQK